MQDSLGKDNVETESGALRLIVHQRKQCWYPADAPAPCRATNATHPYEF